ncbi:MAG: tRNA lysidine(34) synthetase TilS [Clostridia bacterium]|nr:tRNA lysidine(34) synthetase TilS [Clostridia bacterium]
MTMPFCFPRPFPDAARLKPDGNLLKTLTLSYDRAGRPGRVLAAFSGGADSTALVCMLSSLREEWGFSLEAVHVNHGLRAEAGRDESFCRDLCTLLSVPFTARRVTLSGKSEDEARRLRYSALREEAEEHGAAVAAAHHLGDQGETILMNLMRGSVRGLGGMREVSRLGDDTILWRPLLPVSPDRLRSYLAERGIPWTEDATNSDTRYLRNAVRHSILPLMEKARPGTLRHIVGTGSVLREESDWLDREAAAVLRDRCAVDPFPFISAPALYASPHVLRRRCIRLFLEALGVGEKADARLLCALAGLDEGACVTVGGGYTAVRGKEYLYFVPSIPAAALRPMESPFTGDVGDGRRTQSLSTALYRTCVTRYPMPGDTILPFGHRSRRTLMEYFGKMKTDRYFRLRVPVVASGNEIIWAVGVGASELVRRTSPGEERVLLSWPHPLPGDADGSLFTIRPTMGGTKP